MSQALPGNIKTYAFRLSPHQDVKKHILEFAKQNKIKAGCVVSAVGSLEQVNLRFANQEQGTLMKGHFEIGFLYRNIFRYILSPPHVCF
ncbi:MAG: PPC domain-containing DNA-binding protein [Bacteroidota bacterium]